MLEAKKGTFSLINYKIQKFSLSEPTDENVGLSALFDPKGSYFREKNIYILKFNFSISHGENIKTDFITASIEATFKFDSDVKTGEDIPNYFYANCIAIIFPYLRAFITTLTAVSNIKPLILPLLNLSFLESELKQNTHFFD